MGAPIGHKKRGGRAKGSVNRKTELLFEKCERIGVNPFEILLYFAKGDWKALGYDSPERLRHVTDSGQEIYEDVISAELRAQCAKESCQYLIPKKRAIEVTGEMDVGLLDKAKEVQEMSKEEQKRLLEEELKRLKSE